MTLLQKQNKINFLKHDKPTIICAQGDKKSETEDMILVQKQDKT